MSLLGPGHMRFFDKGWDGRAAFAELGLSIAVSEAQFFCRCWASDSSSHLGPLLLSPTRITKVTCP
eukprot:380799-Hanusia_phi.AAC.2